MSMMILILVALLAMPMSAVMQGGGAGCHGLSDTDCQILQDAMTAMHGVHAYDVPEWSFALNMEAEGEPVELAANGSGRMAMPPVLVAMMSELPTGPAAMFDLTPLLRLLEGLDSAVMTQIVQELGLQLTVDQLVVLGPGQNQSGGIDLLFFDGVFYTHLKAPNGAETWFGEQAEIDASMDSDLADMIEELQSDETQAALAQMSELSGVITQLVDVIDSHLVSARGDDQTLNGQTMAVFTTTYDLREFLNDPALADIVAAILANPALGETMDIEPGDINPQLVQLGLTAIALAVKDGTYTWEQWVGLDDGYLHKFATASAITLDMGYLPDADTEPITVAANVSVTLDNINGDIFADVEPPAAFLPLDDSDDFLVGGESMIDAQLEVGQAFSGALTEGDDETDMYGVTLSTGQTVSIEITTDGGSTTLELYGPDGFSVAWFDSYSADALEYTAEQEGRYMLVVEGYWDIKYEVIVRLK